MSLRYLIVDDSEEFVAAAKELLRTQGLDVVGSATSAAQALELVLALTPDVALVDIELGDDDGFDLAERLTVTSPATRVVLISAYDRQELGDLIAGSRAVGFIPKRAIGAATVEGLVGPGGSLGLRSE